MGAKIQAFDIFQTPLSSHYPLPLIWWKKPLNTAQAIFAPVWETPNRTPNIKCIVPIFFADWFVEKEGGLRTHNPSAEEEEGLEAFLCLTDQNFELG